MDTATNGQHTETHFTAGDVVRDVVIGMADGLTVPFALAAGLTGAISQSRLIVTAGLAEIAAGAIAMGLGGFLAARGDAQHYDNERRREEQEILRIPEDEAQEVRDIFRTYGLSAVECETVVASLRRRPNDWLKFMMRFELGLTPPVRGREWKSAVTIGAAYVAGGMIPLAAYMVRPDAPSALRVSILVTLLALAVFGGIKGHLTGIPALRSAVQTMLIGGVAAAAAFAIARAVT